MLCEKENEKKDASDAWEVKVVATMSSIATDMRDIAMVVTMPAILVPSTNLTSLSTPVLPPLPMAGRDPVRWWCRSCLQG